jgi:hypothetical protein
MTRNLLAAAAVILAFAAAPTVSTARGRHHHAHAAQITGPTKGVRRPLHRPLPSRAATAAALTLAPQPAMPCPTQTITIINAAGVPAAALNRVERAIQDQSVQLRAAWGTPCVVFGDGGWPLTLEAGPPPECGTLELAGCHDVGSPIGFADAAAGPLQALTVSHETLEMLADPLGTGTEVCDPVEGLSDAYQLDGLTVSDFALPANFTPGAAGPLDHADNLISPTD